MKNIIPFKKDVIFKTNLSEITSISLENALNLNNDTISGDFIVSGEYKVSDKSTTVEPFELNLPFEIVIDDRYDTKKATIDIDDFYYEIVNNNVLSISIDVLIDKLQEKPLVELDDLVEITPVRDILSIDDDAEEEENKRDLKEEKEEETSEDIMEEVREEVTEPKKEVKEEIKDSKIEDVKEELVESRSDSEQELVEEKINSLFNQFSKDSEVYVTYNVYILRDGDSIDSILEKYNVTEETLRKYNDLSNLQLGDKIIIPNSYERD